MDWNRQGRGWVVAAALLGAVLIVVAYWLPWWHFHLVAPQYPKGLELVVSLTGVGGDAEEVSLLNHYIGMKGLDEAATWERAHALVLLGALSTGVLGMVLSIGRRLNPLLLLVAAGLPVGFLADTFYWMYRFGHELDPHAPVHIKVFTPVLFGEGKIGQFHTYATPESGFYLAVTGVILIGVATYFRNRVCQVCPLHDTCGPTCSNFVKEQR